MILSELERSLAARFASGFHFILKLMLQPEQSFSSSGPADEPRRPYGRGMTLPTCTDSRSARERIEEIAEILALGLQRLNAPKSSRISPENRDNPLDFEPGSHGHVQREREDIGT